MSYLDEFRAQIDEFMARHPQSPLEHEQRHNFQGLDYFDYNPDLVLEVELERFPEDEPLIEMETTTGGKQRYRRYGRFTVDVDGAQGQATIFINPYEGDFFLPFRDATSGQESYPAGRYLDSHRPGLEDFGDGRFAIDFNYSYNPYCAYNLAYSCPLPPIENWLKVPIRAGEKKFEGGPEYGP